jgi:hypothetical protein
MIMVHRGAGLLVILYGILSALLMNILTIKIFGDGYYQGHRWPKLMVLLLAGASCLVTGMLLKKKRERDAQKEAEYLSSLSPKFGAVKEIVYAGSRDHFMYIPLQYWSIVYFVAALIYVAIIR